MPLLLGWGRRAQGHSPEQRHHMAVAHLLLQGLDAWQLGHLGSLCPVHWEGTRRQLNKSPAAYPLFLAVLNTTPKHRVTSAQLGSCAPLSGCS